ncbi:MAG: hypothetical protein JNM56_33185 [Planctomycetia bacterium]|nr:hypothetical protein [Planctomycetia bacterium]
MMAWTTMLILSLLGTLAGGMLLRQWRRHGSAARWLGTYIAETPRRREPHANQDVHVLLCVADHYEPGWGDASPAVARARVYSWLRHYPRLFGDLRDSDGRPPQHTFFYPIEQYAPDLLDGLARLSRGGFGEVEVHLHHDRDTAESLRAQLLNFKDILAERHNLLSRHRDTGELSYGFIHGNWALDNARPDGCWCGVNNELDVLRETGCYADFTLPCAPAPGQTRTINSIYYAVDDPCRPLSHDTGVRAGVGPIPDDALLLIQGPLALNWQRRKWGLLPRIENGCLQANQPPTVERLRLWLRARVQVPQRPDWYFVKLHTHGATERNQEMLLGAPMLRFHRALADYAAANPRFRFHYVTAREMYNLARAAAAGWTGSVAAARDFELIRNDSPLAAALRPTTKECQS